MGPRGGLTARNNRVAAEAGRRSPSTLLRAEEEGGAARGLTERAPEGTGLRVPPTEEAKQSTAVGRDIALRSPAL